MKPVKLIISSKHYPEFRNYVTLSDGNKKRYATMKVGDTYASFTASQIQDVIKKVFHFEYLYNPELITGKYYGSFIFDSADYFYIECQLIYDPVSILLKDKNGNILTQ